ncbi:MAG: glycosyltransferase family 4 protein [Myxococcales bacterium FL481]|nr:MAG: glycosyltransferase family 4 protein [Myxococcales bacterium FL481]
MAVCDAYMRPRAASILADADAVSVGLRGARRRTDGPLRVLRVMPHLASGGTERQCLEILEEIAATYDRTAVVVDLALIGDPRLETVPAPDGLTLRPLYAGTGPRGLWCSSRRLQSIASEYHCVHALLWPAAYVVALAGVGDVATIASLHSSALPYRNWRRTPDRWVYGAMQRVAFNSEAGRGCLAAAIGARPERTLVIPNGKRAYEGPWPSRGGVVCPTRLMEQKRPDLLLAALEEMPTASRPSTVFIGTGTDGAAFKRAARSLAPWVRGDGVVSNAMERMAGAALVASPSDSEGSPNVVLEAWATRTCVVASRVPGVRELVRHGVDGWLVDNSPEAWADALATLLHDDQLRGRLAQAGHARVQTDFSLASAAQRWVQLYAEVSGWTDLSRAPGKKKAGTIVPASAA